MELSSERVHQRLKKKKLLRVATKYPNLTRQFLYSKGVTQFQLVQSLGSTEVAPFTGTAEIISDITSTGATLKANSLRILKDGEILSAVQEERFSRKKHDSRFPENAIKYCLIEENIDISDLDSIVYYEKPWLKKARQLYAGQYSEVFSRKNLPSNYVKQFGIDKIDYYVDHHKSHAAASYYSSPYDEACIITIDAIGEWETLTIWYAWGSHFEKRYSVSYPNSLGLWYSAMTQRLGLKPQEDEFILMGMAAWGKQDDDLQSIMYNDFFGYANELELKQNLHRGCLDYEPSIYPDNGTEQWKFDIAANVQTICEWQIAKVFKKAKELVPETDNMCYSGGVALNCVANSLVVEKQYPNMWILPNPGDAGSSLGCAAYVGGEHIDFDSAFLGYDIKGKYPVKQVVKELLKGNLVGVANGRACLLYTSPSPRDKRQARMQSSA